MAGRTPGFTAILWRRRCSANGVHLVGRSFKYHRPRGILGIGADEPNALVGIRRDAARYTPNLLATQAEWYGRAERGQPEPASQS